MAVLIGHTGQSGHALLAAGVIAAAVLVVLASQQARGQQINVIVVVGSENKT